jgi:hypothetical protein
MKYLMLAILRSRLRKLSLPILLLGLCPLAQADAAPKNKVRMEFKPPFLSRDLHIQADNKIDSVNIDPDPPDAGSNMTNNNGAFQWHGAWQTHATATAAKIKLTISSDELLKGSIVWTYTGNLGEAVDYNTGIPFGTYIEPLPKGFGNYDIKGHSYNDPNPIQIGPIEIIAVSDPAAFTSANWHQASGQTYNLGGGTIAPGEENHVFATNLALGELSWILIRTTVNDVPYEFATFVPEPSTLTLLGPIIALARRPRRKRTAPASAGATS